MAKTLFAKEMHIQFTEYRTHDKHALSHIEVSISTYKTIEKVYLFVKLAVEVSYAAKTYTPKR